MTYIYYPPHLQNLFLYTYRLGNEIKLGNYTLIPVKFHLGYNLCPGFIVLKIGTIEMRENVLKIGKIHFKLNLI